MVTVDFDEFKDSASKFDRQAPIAFVVESDGVWVKTGSRAKMLCYKESAVVTGLPKNEDGTSKPVCFCIQHASVNEVLDAFVTQEGIKHKVSMTVDTAKNIVKFAIKHYEIEKVSSADGKTTEEKVVDLGKSNRGPYRFMEGQASKVAIDLPTEIDEETRETYKDSIDHLDGAMVSKIFSTLGVLKEAIMISAATENADSKAMVCGKIFGVMPAGKFKRGMRITPELASPIAKLITSGDVECLARVDSAGYRVMTLVTKDFFVSGLVEKTDDKNVGVMQITNVAALDYSDFGVSCRKAMFSSVPDGLQELEMDENSLTIGADDIRLIRYLSKKPDLANILKKGVNINMDVVKKFLHSYEAVVDIDVAPYLTEGQALANCKNLVLKFSGETTDCVWYVPVVVK